MDNSFNIKKYIDFHSYFFCLEEYELLGFGPHQLLLHLKIKFFKQSCSKTWASYFSNFLLNAKIALYHSGTGFLNIQIFDYYQSQCFPVHVQFFCFLPSSLSTIICHHFNHMFGSILDVAGQPVFSLPYIFPSIFWNLLTCTKTSVSFTVLFP